MEEKKSLVEQVKLAYNVFHTAQDPVDKKAKMETFVSLYEQATTYYENMRRDAIGKLAKLESSRMSDEQRVQAGELKTKCQKIISIASTHLGALGNYTQYYNAIQGLTTDLQIPTQRPVEETPKR